MLCIEQQLEHPVYTDWQKLVARSRVINLGQNIELHLLNFMEEGKPQIH